MPAAALLAEAAATLAAASLGALLLLSAEPAPFLITGGLLSLAAISIWIAVQDLRTFTIADGASAAFGLIGGALRLRAEADAGADLLSTTLTLLAEAAAVFALLWLLREVWYRRSGVDGLGLGDVKLAGAGTLALGLQGLSFALLVASLLGLTVFAALRLIRGPAGARARLPFGALFAPALFAVAVAGPERLADLLADFLAWGAP